jgi:hypothetical protein
MREDRDGAPVRLSAGVRQGVAGSTQARQAKQRRPALTHTCKGGPSFGVRLRRAGLAPLAGDSRSLIACRLSRPPAALHD